MIGIFCDYADMWKFRPLVSCRHFFDSITDSSTVEVLKKQVSFSKRKSTLPLKKPPTASENWQTGGKQYKCQCFCESQTAKKMHNIFYYTKYRQQYQKPR